MRTALIFIIGLFTFSSLSVFAQESAGLDAGTGVFVTTQDFSALREGPGRGFARLDVVPPAVTLPAVGRTNDARWIQVEFGEKRGWIASWLLVWSGDMLALQADGVNPVSFIRRRGPVIDVSREMFIYDQQFAAPGARIDFPAETARVEVTGRLGSGNNFWLQFWYVDRYYWLGAWNLHLAVPGIYFSTVPDAAYVYPFGRLLGKVYGEYSETRGVYTSIRSIWFSLASGQSISCDLKPEPVETLGFSDADLDSEPVFVPAVRALQTAADQTNSAISRLEAACSLTGSDRFLTTDMVEQALSDLGEAGRNLDLVSILLSPVSNRDPALGG